MTGLHNGTIWSELGKVLGGMDSPDHHLPTTSSAISKPPGGSSNSSSGLSDLTTRSASIDLGIPLTMSAAGHHANNLSQNNDLPGLSQCHDLPLAGSNQT